MGRGVHTAPGTVGIRDGVEAIAAIARQVAADCERDVMALDETSFTAVGLGVVLGGHLGMTHATASLVAQLAEAVVLLSRTVDLLQGELNQVTQAVGS